MQRRIKLFSFFGSEPLNISGAFGLMVGFLGSWLLNSAVINMMASAKLGPSATELLS